jgi:hypothetical protein
MDGHNDFFRSRVRRLLRDTLGLEQRAAQEWAEKADSWVDLGVIKGIKCLWKAGPAGMTAAIGVGAVAHQRVIRSTWHLPEYLLQKAINKLKTRR